MDSVSEERLNDVHPVLAARVHDLADKLLAIGITIRITQGLRTWAQQLALYNQGRTSPGKRVTDAQPGFSMHNYGLAVDFTVMDGALPDWDKNDPEWKGVLLVASSCGLAEGATWRTFPDYPHLYPNELPADPDDNMRAIFEAAGLGAVWEDVDKTYFTQSNP